MYRIDTSDAATTKPTRAAAGPKPNGHFTSTATDGTQVTDDWAEAVQEELTYVVEQAGVTLDKADDTQLHEAIGILCDVEPVPVDSGTIALSQTAAGPYSYNIADFSHTTATVNTDQIREVHILVGGSVTNGTGSISCTMFGASQQIFGISKSGTTNTVIDSRYVTVSISPTQTTLDLSITESAADVSYTIIGVTQRTFS